MSSVPVGVSRPHARISLNELTKYMIASPHGRRMIIKEQKRPTAIKTSFYSDAQKPITRYLVGRAENDLILRDAIRRLESLTPKSVWDERRIARCIEAIESVLEMAGFPFLNGVSLRDATQKSANLTVGGVLVSIRPEIETEAAARDGATTRGAIKLYISKRTPLDNRTGDYAATMLHQYMSTLGDSLPRRCVVLDVFAQSTFEAPQHFTNRRRDIEAACNEIRLAWPEVQ